MKITHKFKPEIVRFIINSKLKNPDISCRKLALEASEKFSIKLSKSAINNILKKEKLSSPVGRKSERLFHPEGERANAGFYILKALDGSWGISETATEALLNVSPSARKSFAKEIENVIQALIIFKSIFDITIDFAKLYDNTQVWEIAGRRPTKATYARITKMLQASQVFTEEALKEIRQRLNPV
ncbi:MAG: helix-turn-helix domain-containing protein, partial [Candidatus Omnitrophica bacterium]|nr:helix-turn-helix domain-containing protein [Candidatus Omnitrophota bacterium]